jgi:superfamily II DNA/RNA helicase
MSSFAALQLESTILKNLAHCQYETPTQIQQKAIPLILAGKDMIASAPTGTGKTAAFVLPVLQHLAVTRRSNKASVLILTPTRELATQITDAIRQYGKNLKVKAISIVGGMSYGRQFRDLAGPVDIIVATPGRLNDHIENKRIDLSQIKVLVLDEADRMLDMGFIGAVKQIAAMTPKERQTLLFSATMDEQIGKLAKSILNNPERISLESKTVAQAQISQKLYLVNQAKHKSILLKHLLTENNIYKAIIFSATKRDADRIAQDLRDSGYLASALHGDMKQNMRTRTIESLRNGKIQLLVATDVGSRGLDIDDLSHVINYHLPRTAEDYVHRIGRTGRAGREGIAISLALPDDGQLVKRIEKYIGASINREKVASEIIPAATFSDNAAPKKRTFRPKRFGQFKRTDRRRFS